MSIMSENNKEMALNILDKLRTEGCTNIWDGLEKGMEVLRKNKLPSNHQTIIMLTDGDPNVYPNSGFLPSLKSYEKKYDWLPTINTIAFGKNIDSQLLNDFALNGNGGSYSFIPCPGFIGTIMVNSFSNTLSTMASNSKVHIELNQGVKIEKVMGGFPTEINHDDKKDILLGNL